MKYLYLVVLFAVNISIWAQEKDTYRSRDTVLIIGERLTEDRIGQSRINVEKLQLSGFVNYDLMNYLKILGINSQSDYNTILNTEGSDFNEMQVFIGDIPIPYQTRLLGLQSGLNSLIFSEISLLESNFAGTYSSPVKLKIKPIYADTARINLKSDLSFLHTENMLTLPLSNMNGGVVLGYNRSLLESIKPFLSPFINKKDFSYDQFPFFQGYEFLTGFKLLDLNINSILIYSDENGLTEISSKDFGFHSSQLNSGLNVQKNFGQVDQSFQFYYNRGSNNIDYKFNDTQEENVTGNTQLSFKEAGISSSTKFNFLEKHEIDLVISERHQNAHSENNITSDSNYRSASYSSDYFRSKIFYHYLLSGNLLASFNLGFNSFRLSDIYPSTGIDIYYSNPDLSDVRFQLSYDVSNEPVNPIYYSFQNTIWDPASTNSLFFVDESDLPLKPVKCLNTSLDLKKQISRTSVESDVSIKIYWRNLKNLMYTNSYPDEVTIYNADLMFNQNYNGSRYGLTVLFSNNIKSLLLKNITSFNLCRSVNYDLEKKINFYSLNYNPVSITNLTQYQLNNFFINLYFIYSSGRYLFNKKLNSFYSSEDSTYSYSISTDYYNHSNLRPYIRCDFSLLYKIISGDFNLNIGMSILNIFDRKNESNREYRIDVLNRAIIEKSEYLNLPRFIIFEFNMNLMI